MIGNPKYKLNDKVTFECCNEIKHGIIRIVDKYGIFEDVSDVFYDILVTDENCLYKHIKETEILN